MSAEKPTMEELLDRADIRLKNAHARLLEAQARELEVMCGTGGCPTCGAPPPPPPPRPNSGARGVL